MQTFDIAKKHLSVVDFSTIDFFDETQIMAGTPIGKQIEIRLEKFLVDPRNNKSNEYYRKYTFVACIYHLIDIAHNRPSWWDEACKIVESDKAIIETNFEGFTEGSSYPKIMVDKFIKYCDEKIPQPPFLSENSDVRIELFMAAFEYITNPNS